MNINVSIVDQQVRGLAERLKSSIEQSLDKRNLEDRFARSVAFVILCQKTMLALTDDEALYGLTEGSNDFGVDALDVSDAVDGEFTVTLFQGKYHHENLEGTKNFPEDGVLKAVQAVRALFNPSAPVHLNKRLQIRVEEIRALILDGYIPRVRFLLCSNGIAWKKPEAQAIIDREAFPESVQIEHVNHDQLVQILQATQPVNDTIQFAGKAIVEDLDYARVLVGKIPVSELARLMTTHGDRLLERNIRRYLGLQGNRVNEAIQSTLVDPKERTNFYFYNNGITLTCERFDYNALQKDDYKVRVVALQIINGGQTSKTIQRTLAVLSGEDLDNVYVLVRLYQVASDSSSFVQTITYATNSQNPVDLKDLRSNDKRQRELELSMRELGYEYRRQRSEHAPRSTDITTGTAAEAVLAVWKQHPQQAKFRSGEHFGKLYDTIFTPELSAAQVIVAVLLFRIAENKRKRPPADAPEFISYASCFAAMLMGKQLLKDLGITLNQLDHRNFDMARQHIESRGEAYFAQAMQTLDQALIGLYGNRAISLQQLAATFRRGDLFRYLPE